MHIAMVCQYHEYKNAISDLTSSPWGERRENIAPSPLSERDTSQFFLRPENKIIFWNFPTCRNCSCRRGRGGGTWCQSRWGRAGGSLHLSSPCHQSPWETSVMCRVLKTGERVFWNWIWKYFGCPDITCWSFSLWFPRRRDSPCLRNQTPLETLEWGVNMTWRALGHVQDDFGHLVKAHDHISGLLRPLPRVDDRVHCGSKGEKANLH